MFKNFVFTFFGVVILMLGVVTALSCLFDPIGIFPNNNFYEKEITKKINSSNSVHICTNFNDRKFIKNYISQYATKPDILIVGSSTMMGISSSLLNSKVLNSSISSAGPQDLIAINQISSKILAPRKVLLGLNYTTFDKSYSFDRWRPLKGDLDAAIINNSGYKDLVDTFIKINFYEILSLASLTESLKRLFQLLEFQYATNLFCNDGAIILLKDGSRVLGNTYLDDKDYAQVLDPWISDYTKKMHAFNPKSFRAFEVLIDSMLAKGILVELILPPFHPYVYNKISLHDENIKIVEDKFRTFAKERQIALRGSYNPQKIGCNEKDFLDTQHFTDGCYKKILNLKQ